MTSTLPPDMPIRPAFWNVPLWGEIGIYVLGILTLIVCGYGIWLSFKKLHANGQALPKDPDRKRRFWQEVIAQKRVRQTKPGLNHFFLVIGFFLLFLGTATATLDWDVGHYVFGQQFLKGNVYLAYKLILDIAGLTAFIAICLAAYRRYLTPNQLPKDRRFAYVYASLAFVIFTGFLVEGLRLAAQQPLWMHFSPVGTVFAQALLALFPNSLKEIHVWVWTIHGLAALAFILAIPCTFYAHIYKTPTGIMTRKPDPIGALPKVDNIEEQETFGLSKVGQITWLQKAQLQACVECGRCNDVCPAVKAKTPLSPRELILKLRALSDQDAETSLLEGQACITRDELFSCTTCGACARACPAQIQTPDFIVEMRRHLALEQGEFPEGAQTALENVASVGNPWGLDPYERLDWTKDLEVPIAQEGQTYDILYWVGCAASYDRRARKIARAMVKILKHANVNFAIMQEERCHGEFARRLGEEYLYQTAAQENIENFQKYRFKRILAACPHCFNTLGNEYKAFEGGQFDVIDHTRFIQELLAQGALKLKDKTALTTTLHDPCYLARINGVTQAPRALIEATGPLKEVASHGEQTLCCGAGGGQMWSDGDSGKRMNVIRIQSLQATKADRIAVACPHCLTMLNSAQSTLQSDTPLMDISEIIEQALIPTTH